MCPHPQALVYTFRRCREKRVRPAIVRPCVNIAFANQLPRPFDEVATCDPTIVTSSPRFSHSIRPPRFHRRTIQQSCGDRSAISIPTNRTRHCEESAPRCVLANRRTLARPTSRGFVCVCVCSRPGYAVLYSWTHQIMPRTWRWWWLLLLLYLLGERRGGRAREQRASRRRCNYTMCEHESRNWRLSKYNLRRVVINPVLHI